jgi:hypothetical protein
MSTQRFPTITTPKGTAIFPKLNEPDKKFNPEGVYSVTLRLPDTEAKPLIGKLTQMHDQMLAEETKKLGKKNLKTGTKPWKTATDWDKESESRVDVPGFTDFTFKLKAKVTTKTGKTWEQRPMLFDAKLVPLPQDSDPVGGGSTIRVNAEVYPWYTPSLGFGISLRPRGVQVLDLKTYSTAKDGSSFGFQADDDGYAFTGAAESKEEQTFDRSGNTESGDF